MTDPVSVFYQKQLPDGELKNNILTAPCPFCSGNNSTERGKLILFLNPSSYFHGYFRCNKRCTPGGFPLRFGRLAKLNMSTVPGYDPDREYDVERVDYPAKNINEELLDFADKMTPELYRRFAQFGIGRDVLKEMRIGYNGRYLVYPYFQEDGNCYAAHCIHPDRPGDAFWYGDEQFATFPHTIYNGQDIGFCENGSLIITEGEENLLLFKQLGLPCIALPDASDLSLLSAEALRYLSTVFLFVNHNPEAETSARSLAKMLGHKARLVHWPEQYGRRYSIIQLAREEGSRFPSTVFTLLKNARAFSPFTSPEHDHLAFVEDLKKKESAHGRNLQSCFPLLNEALGGISGINIMGGLPKAGKSTFFLQIASEMARQKIPVIYYDFENGKNKIYLRTLARINRLSGEAILSRTLSETEEATLNQSLDDLKEMLTFFRVVNDRALSPELMRRQIDFLCHETHSDQVLVVIDSLHKLPFKDLSKRRTGINAWLRELEAIRDTFGASFLVISELSRGENGQYDRQPHMGSFKGSGDIEYSADNAMILLPKWSPFDTTPQNKRHNELWLVASREKSPGLVATYQIDFPFWGFVEHPLSSDG
ncbi:MAG: AAA family ATPase [Thermodesulfobacteria bacterium]|nr:AAA family ATPase [Thermodesulfobacteriota bacterium]